MIFYTMNDPTVSQGCCLATIKIIYLCLLISFVYLTAGIMLFEMEYPIVFISIDDPIILFSPDDYLYFLAYATLFSNSLRKLANLV